MINGQENLEIEPRLISLKKNPENQIYWLCLDCLHEAEDIDLKKSNYVCLNEVCKTKNILYPFTSKYCANCKTGETYRELPIWALACEKCGEKNFVLNGETPVNALKRNGPNYNKTGGKFEEFIPPIKTSPDINTNQISLNLQVLNNRYDIMLYGEGKTISFREIIEYAEGFTPESIYFKYITKFSLNEPFIEIKFNEEREEFSFSSVLKFTKVPLSPRFDIIGELEELEAGNDYLIPEGKLLQLEETFFKIQLWVY